MNRLVKIGFALLLIGIGVSIAFGIISGEGISSFYKAEDYELRELTYSADEFSSIDLFLDNKQVIILPSESDEIILSFYESEKSWMDVTLSGTSLEIQNEQLWYADFFIGFDFFNLSTYNKFYLYLPTTEIYNLYVDTSNGSIEVSDLSVFDELNLNSSNGEVTLINVTALHSVLVDTSNGKIILNNVEALVIEVETSNGAIEGSSILAESIDCYTSNGPISMQVEGNFDDYFVSLNTINGKLYIDDGEVVVNQYHTTLENEIKLRTSNGTIRLNFTN
ncbi:MAG: DUF4097 domain-containing protein [Firmicutes bacterium]|nr:DUF4097 domain-containing protein [Bacillota bacterium]